MAPNFPDLTDPYQMSQFAGRFAKYSDWNNPPSASSYPGSTSSTGFPGGATGYPSGNYRSTNSTFSPGYPNPTGSASSSSGPMDAGALLRLYGVNQPDIRQSPVFSNQFMDAHPALG